MTLIGYRSANHPQQVAKRGARPEIDDRAIRDKDFVPLHEWYRFTIDAAASDSNAKLLRYWTREENALFQSWAGERVWCNPPYSDIESWIGKAWDEWTKTSIADRPELIVMLLPANRTEQGWWQTLVEPHRDRRNGFGVKFLSGRMRFDRPNAVIGPKGDRPPFGSCLLIWGTT